jgi:D-3-phosphoglycerate dehydrogenase
MFRISGRTLGILGFGKIGQTLAAKARGLGLKLIAHDPFLPEQVFAQQGVESVSLPDLFSRSDYVSVHMPLSAQTRHLVGQDLLRLMKPTSFLINTSRGGVIDQAAVILALQEGWIAGAGLDVFEPERLAPDHPLLHVPNLLATPHVAFYSEESVVELETKAAQNVADILVGKRPGPVVNPQVLDLPRWAHLGK